MDERTRRVIETAGMENLLTNFVNLPIKQDASAAEDFKRQYCELVPGMPVENYGKYVKIFLRAWRARSLKEKRLIEQRLESILRRDGDLALYERPNWQRILSGEHLSPFQIDFDSGQIRIEPDTLLDKFVSVLLEFRELMAICESKKCSHRYFLRSHGRQRFCSHSCASEVRAQKKAKWWKENRERHIRKWRMQRRLNKKRSAVRRNKRKEN